MKLNFIVDKYLLMRTKCLNLLGKLIKSDLYVVVFNFIHDSNFSLIRRLLSLLLIMFMKDCSHLHVEPKRERIANASFCS